MQTNLCFRGNNPIRASWAAVSFFLAHTCTRTEPVGFQRTLQASMFLCVKVKVKFALEQGTKSQRERIGIDLLFL